MTLSIGPATDYIVGLATQAVVGVTVNGEPVQVVDGSPDVLEMGSFVVGLSEPPPNVIGETASTRARLTAEVGLSSDTYLIPCYIDIRIGGRSQKAARDIAERVFNAFWTGLIADLSLGGALRNGTAELTEITAVPGNVGTAAEPGRRQLLSFGVTCIAQG